MLRTITLISLFALSAAPIAAASEPIEFKCERNWFKVRTCEYRINSPTVKILLAPQYRSSDVIIHPKPGRQWQRWSSDSSRMRYIDEQFQEHDVMLPTD